MRTFTYSGAFIVVALLLGCATPHQDLPYHFSGDFQTQVLYLSPSIAIQKHLKVYSNGEAQTFYAVGRAHREDAELAADTGDRFDASVRGTIKRLSTSSDGCWLLVESEDDDRTTRQPVRVFYMTAILLSSGQMYTVTNAVELSKTIPAEILSSTKFEPVELFFDRSVILRLHHPLE